MKFTKEQKRVSYQKLSPEIQSFIGDPEIMDLITKILESSGLSGEQEDLADSEIHYTLCGLQDLSEAITSIAKILNKKPGDLAKLKTDLEKNVFSKIPESKTEATKISDQKINNIAQKYSLASDQTEKLTALHSEHTPEQIKSGDFPKKLSENLEISSLVAEQIAEDMKKSMDKPQKATPQPISKVPEIKPVSLPMVEKGEVAKDVKKDVTQEPVRATSSLYKQGSEQVQKPYSVPRFGVASIPPKVEVINLNQTKPTDAPNMMDSKMTAITTNIPLDMQKKPKPSPDLPTTKYNLDPYREPLS